MTRRMIIDTDTAADDSFAMLVGLRHPSAQLEAVTIVAGNVAFDQQVQNALITIEQAGRGGEVPVHLGARTPLLREWVEASAHGDGKGNHAWPVPTQAPSDERAAEAIVRIVDENPGEIDIVAIGPLTNIATAVALDRDLPRKTRSLWIMGGCENSIGNITAAAEYNFYVDPEAAQLVLSAGFSTTIVTWTVTLERALWTGDQLQELSALGTPLSEFFRILDTPNLEFNRTVGIDGSTHPDSLTAMLLVRPDLITASQRLYVEVDTRPGLTRGYSLMDDRPARNAPNATVITDIDAPGFFAAYRSLLAVE